MTYTIEWIVPDHLLVIHLEGLVTPAVVAASADDMYQRLFECHEKSNDLVHFIIDSANASMGKQVREYMSIPFKRSPNTGWVIITGTSGLMRMIMSVFSALIPGGMQFTAMSNVAEAVTFLSKRDLAIASFISTHQPLSSDH
ncbi:MAG TPA: hypothetical protein VHL11_16350 [Phototrophicaceae bacterium]|nr:hypothetical protein [Phototrophicaceae bacterium]